MPPTAIEIKARLDKAVDQEGNVLDMEAVLEIVASLEKIVMTKESLEATRIGKTINLMRKKTTNEDLSKRAKKLVKRWQTVVNNHLKKTFKSENLNGVVKRKEVEQPGSLNGNKTETQYTCSTELESKLGPKRKRFSPDICPLTSNIKQSLSPRLVSSPKHGISSKLGLSPRLGVSPKQGVTPKHVISSKQGFSPKIKSQLDYSKTKPLSCVSHLALNSSAASEELKTELNCSGDFLNYSHHNNIQTGLNEKRNELAQLANPLEFFCNNGANKAAGTDATATNSTDTRVQENRIVLTDYISTITNNILPKETYLDTSEINISTKKKEPIKEFIPIEPEDLQVVRKELPENITSPGCEADGVNGVYNEKNVWCPWKESVQQRDSEFLLLPYVILD